MFRISALRHTGKHEEGILISSGGYARDPSEFSRRSIHGIGMQEYAGTTPSSRISSVIVHDLPLKIGAFDA
jgi:hypothetical protein